MLTHICAKLPMRDKVATRAFYIDTLGFQQLGGDYDEYLMVQKDGVEIHFFAFKALDPAENYGQVYIRSNDIEADYQYIRSRNVKTTPLENKPWQQTEFALLDPDNNLLTFGQNI